MGGIPTPAAARTIADAAQIDGWIERVFERQRRAPSWREKRDRLEAFLDRLKVGAGVRERVLRLNPDPREGYQLRGLRRTEGSRLINQDCVTKGWFIRTFGRAAFEALPSAVLQKRGRQVFVSYIAVMQRGAQ